MDISATKHELFIVALFPIVIPIVIIGAGRNWWAKKKK